MDCRAHLHSAIPAHTEYFACRVLHQARADRYSLPSSFSLDKAGVYAHVKQTHPFREPNLRLLDSEIQAFLILSGEIAGHDGSSVCSFVRHGSGLNAMNCKTGKASSNTEIATMPRGVREKPKVIRLHVSWDKKVKIGSLCECA